MHILLIGSKSATDLLVLHLKNSPAPLLICNTQNQLEELDNPTEPLSAVFDCSGEADVFKILSNKKIIGSTTYYFVNILAKNSLEAFNLEIDGYLSDKNYLFSFNGEPFFLQSKVLEIGKLEDQSSKRLDLFFEANGIKNCIIQDRPGLFGARVVCMIINEAYMLLEENISDAESINTAMQLGANYPGGPFDWVKQIRLNKVFQILNAAQAHSKDERYQPCALLTNLASQSQSQSEDSNLI